MRDVVCIHEKTTPRQPWRLGRVQRLLPGPGECVEFSSFWQTKFLSDDVPISIAFPPDVRVAIKAFPVGEKNEGYKKDAHCNI